MVTMPHMRYSPWLSYLTSSMVHDILTTHVVQWCPYPHVEHYVVFLLKCSTVHGVLTLCVVQPTVLLPHVLNSTWYEYLTLGTVRGFPTSLVVQYMVFLSRMFYSTW
jgi:hypothetical protein